MTAHNFVRFEVDWPRGIANVGISDSIISLDGPNSIILKSIVVHEKEDDGSRLGGNAGMRVACGTIHASTASSLNIFHYQILLSILIALNYF